MSSKQTETLNLGGDIPRILTRQYLSFKFSEEYDICASSVEQAKKGTEKKRKEGNNNEMRKSKVFLSLISSFWCSERAWCFIFEFSIDEAVRDSSANVSK